MRLIKSCYLSLISILLLQLALPPQLSGPLLAQAQQTAELEPLSTEQLGTAIGDVLFERFKALFVTPGVCWVEGSPDQFKDTAQFNGQTVDCEKEKAFFDQFMTLEAEQAASDATPPDPNRDQCVPEDQEPGSELAKEIEKAANQAAKGGVTDACHRKDGADTSWVSGCFKAYVQEFTSLADQGLRLLGVRGSETPESEGCIGKIWNVLWSGVTSLLDLASLAWQGIQDLGGWAWESLFGVEDAASDDALRMAQVNDGESPKSFVSRMVSGIGNFFSNFPQIMRQLYIDSACTRYEIKTLEDGTQQRSCAYEVPGLDRFNCLSCAEMKNMLCSLGGVALDFILGSYVLKGVSTFGKAVGKFGNKGVIKSASLVKATGKSTTVGGKVGKLAAGAVGLPLSGTISAAGWSIYAFGKVTNGMLRLVNKAGKVILLPTKVILKSFKLPFKLLSKIKRLPGGKWTRVVSEKVTQRTSTAAKRVKEKLDYVEAFVDTGFKPKAARAKLLKDSGDQLARARRKARASSRSRLKRSKGARQEHRDAAELHVRRARQYRDRYPGDYDQVPKLSKKEAVLNANDQLARVRKGQLSVAEKERLLDRTVRDFKNSGLSQDQVTELLIAQNSWLDQLKRTGGRLLRRPESQMRYRINQNFSNDEVSSAISRAFPSSASGTSTPAPIIVELKRRPRAEGDPKPRHGDRPGSDGNSRAKADRRRSRNSRLKIEVVPRAGSQSSSAPARIGGAPDDSVRLLPESSSVSSAAGSKAVRPRVTTSGSAQPNQKLLPNKTGKASVAEAPKTSTSTRAPERRINRALNQRYRGMLANAKNRAQQRQALQAFIRETGASRETVERLIREGGKKTGFGDGIRIKYEKDPKRFNDLLDEIYGPRVRPKGGGTSGSSTRSPQSSEPSARGRLPEPSREMLSGRTVG